MFFCQLIADDRVSVSSNLAKKIQHFICNLHAVNSDLFGLSDQILEKVSFLVVNLS